MTVDDSDFAFFSYNYICSRVFMEKDHSYELNLLQVCPKQQAVWTGSKITFQEKHCVEVSFTFFQADYLFQIMFLSTIDVVD
jgi:ferredoxin-like protein FixX